MLSLLLSGCASLTHPYRPSFVEMAREGIARDGSGTSFSATGGASSDKNYAAPSGTASQSAARDLYKPLRFSDQLALSYADNVADILRGKFHRARVVREASNTTQVGLAALAGAAGPFKLRPDTLAGLGLGTVVIHELQGIFNAKGRAENYQEAVRLIEEAEVEYLSYNPSPSAGYMTQNGVTLVHRTNAAIHVVEQALAGLLPTLEQMKQATERMSVEGTRRHQSGDRAANNISAAGSEPAALRPGEAINGRGEVVVVKKRAAVKDTDENVNQHLANAVTEADLQAVRDAIFNADETAKTPTDYPALMKKHIAPVHYLRNRQGFTEWITDSKDKNLLQAVRAEIP